MFVWGLLTSYILVVCIKLLFVLLVSWTLIWGFLFFSFSYCSFFVLAVEVKNIWNVFLVKLN